MQGLIETVDIDVLNSNCMNKRLPNKCRFPAEIIILLFIIFFPTRILAQRPELIIPATHSAYSVVISPDGKWVVSAGRDGLKIWDNKTGSLIKNLAPGSRDNQRFDGGKIVMTIDNGSKSLAMQIADTVYLFDFEKFAVINKIKVRGFRTAMIFSADANTLYAAGRYSYDNDSVIVEKINCTTGKNELIKNITVKKEDYYQAKKLSISPDGSVLMISDKVNASWLINIETGKTIKIFEKNANSTPYEFLANGNIITLSGKSEKIFYIEELDGKNYRLIRKSKTIFTSQFNTYPIEAAKTYPSLSGKILLSYTGNFVVFNPADFSAGPKKPDSVSTNYNTQYSQDIALSPAGDYFIVGANMTRVNSSTFTMMSAFGQFPLDSYVQFVYKNKDAVCLKDRVLNFDNGVFNLRLVDPDFRSDYTGFLYRLTADGETGFLYSEEDGLFQFDATKAKILYHPVTKINNMHKKFVGMQIFDTLNILVLTGNEGIYVMDLKTLKVLYIVDIPFGLHYSNYERLNKYCDFSPDNTKMILFAEAKADTGNFIYCVDLADRNVKWSFQSVNIRNLRFADNGKKLSFTSNDKLFYLDAETGKKTGDDVQLPKSDFETIISPSGRYAATQIPADTKINAGSDIGLVDALNNKSIGIMKGTGDDLHGFVFLHNERYMLTEEYGGLCLWDLTKKRKVGKIYMFERSGDWVLLADDGRFDATAGALKKMYFTKGKEVIPMESLYERFYVPGLLKQIWDNTYPDNTPDLNDLKSAPVIKISLDAKERNLEVADAVTVIKTDKEQVLIKAEADGLKDIVSEIRLYQNGKLVHTTRNLTVEDDNKGEKMLTKTFIVTLSPGQNNFKAIAINSQRTESLPAQLTADFTPANVPVVPGNADIELHLLVVGINVYKNPKYSLNYANADAKAFIEAITQGSQNLFNKVNTIFLKDEEATRQGFTEAFEKIRGAARPQDLFIFYYAGHGVINDKKEFFLVPYDVTQLYGNDGALAQKGFSASTLQQMSKDIKAEKQLFILDACQSAGALETIAATRGAAEEKAIAQLARSTGTQWLTASGSEQFASEFSQLGHGSFTYCLLEAFKGDAGTPDKKLTVKQLDAYLQTKVPEITKKYKGTEQYPSSYSYGNDFPIIITK